MKIGLIGKGTVGTAVYEGLHHLGHQMSFFDLAYKNSTLSDVLNTDCIFICVPTDQKNNGDCDTSIVEKVISELHEVTTKELLLLKALSFRVPQKKSLCNIQNLGYVRFQNFCELSQHLQILFIIMIY